MQWLSILIVAAVAALFWWLSKQRERRLYAYTDPFARAFCEAADHLLTGFDANATLRYRVEDGGYLTVLPAEEQPEAIRALLQKGVDAYVMERLRTMYRMRDEAQALLTTVNLVGEKYNAALNHCYDLSNLFFSFVDDPRKLKTMGDLSTFNEYLQKQAFIRNTTLAAITSDACKREISVA